MFSSGVKDIIAPAAKSGIEEQSFTIEQTGTAVAIKAGGAIGAMYGLQELAEQISNEGKRGIHYSLKALCGMLAFERFNRCG